MPRLLADGRFGYRVNGGYSKSDTWDRSRTLFNGTSLQEEYADATDTPVPLTVERLPLKGQTVDTAAGGVPVGDRDPLENVYGAGRLDYYFDNGSVLSVDGGASQVQNGLFVTGIGRVQVDKAVKPYARVSMAAERFNVFAYWNSRTSIEPQSPLPRGRKSKSAPTSSTWKGRTTGFSTATVDGWCTAPRCGTPRSTPAAP